MTKTAAGYIHIETLKKTLHSDLKLNILCRRRLGIDYMLPKINVSSVRVLIFQSIYFQNSVNDKKCIHWFSAKL